jgi:hypothetical protein
MTKKKTLKVQAARVLQTNPLVPLLRVCKCRFGHQVMQHPQPQPVSVVSFSTYISFNRYSIINLRCGLRIDANASILTCLNTTPRDTSCRPSFAIWQTVTQLLPRNRRRSMAILILPSVILAKENYAQN